MLAVLPFENLSGDPQQDYVSDGLTEELITQLGRLNAEEFGVIARTSVMVYKVDPQPLTEIARQLGVDYALEVLESCYNGAIMMARTQIALDPETRRRARERAADLGISFAEYIRTLVERDLARPSQNADPSVVFDLGSSNGSDVARNKDSMLGAAVESERSRKTSK